jgi:hypothetical protein
LFFFVLLVVILNLNLWYWSLAHTFSPFSVLLTITSYHSYEHRYLGFKKTLLLDRKLIVALIDQYKNGTLSWADFSSAVKASHSGRMGEPSRRQVISDKPKEEDYFYANPHECLQQPDGDARSMRARSLP